MYFSIIIPVYNAEEYLSRCLKSIFLNPIENGEVLIIDDNSIDGSWTIACEYAKKYPQCKVIKTRDNVGVSAARNLGLELAEGEFLLFMDSDDYWVDNRVFELLRCASNDKLVIGGFEITYLEKQIAVQQIDCYEEININEFLGRLIRIETQYYYGVLWNKIFSAKIIKENMIRFREDINLCEEWSFILEYVQHIQKVKLVPSYFYAYTQDNDNSLGKQIRKRGENWRIMLSVYNNICAVYKRNGLYELYVTEISTFLLNPFIKELIEQVEAKESLSVMKELVNHEAISFIISTCKARDKFEKIVIELVKHKKFGLINIFLHMTVLYSDPYKKKKAYNKVIDCMRKKEGKKK